MKECNESLFDGWTLAMDLGKNSNSNDWTKFQRLFNGCFCSHLVQSNLHLNIRVKTVSGNFVNINLVNNNLRFGNIIWNVWYRSVKFVLVVYILHIQAWHFVCVYLFWITGPARQNARLCMADVRANGT